MNTRRWWLHWKSWREELAKAVAHHLKRGTAREAEALVAEMDRLPYSRSSFDRVAHVVGDLYAIRNHETCRELARSLRVREHVLALQTWRIAPSARSRSGGGNASSPAVTGADPWR